MHIMMQSLVDVNIMIQSLFDLHITIQSLFDVHIMIQSIFDVHIMIQSLFDVHIMIQSLFDTFFEWFRSTRTNNFLEDHPMKIPTKLYFQIFPVVSEKKIKMQKFTDNDRRRWTPSKDNTSHDPLGQVSKKK